MGRFIGLTKNKGSGLAIEDPDFDNSGLVLTSNGTGFVLAGGAALDRTVLPDFVNSNQSISTNLVATGAFDNSVYTFAWRDGVQYGLSLSSSGALSGSASTMDAESVLKFDIYDSTYDITYEADVTIQVSLSNAYPAITTNPTSTVSLSPGVSQTTFSASNSPTEWSIISAGTLPNGTTINNSGVLTFGSISIGTFTYTFTLGVRNSSLPAGVYSTTSFNKSFTFQEPIGQQQYQGAYGQNGGQCSFTWVAPTGVQKVNVMAIGGGGGGRYDWASCGGHGGGMVWANDIPVTPGQGYTVQVGRGGCWNGTTGGCSCWPGMKACGGCCGCYGGCFDFGSVGASGACCGGYGMMAYNNTGGGGGGAAGYCSAAPASSQTANYCGCGGGGGSGTSHHSSTFGSGGGGGTGSCGMCCYRSGSCGACGNPGYSHQTGSGGQGGSGGSCGNPGEPWSNWRGNGYNCGGSFGGGGGGGGTQHGGGWGGPGVVRIIWGAGRNWPCTNTHNL